MKPQSNASPPNFGEERLDAMQRNAFQYFLNETNPANGLVADKSQRGATASIAAVGFALAAYPVGVERAWISRTEAVARTLAALRFFWTSAQGPSADTTGDSGFLLAGMRLDCAPKSDLPLLCQACEVRHRGICGALDPKRLQQLGRQTGGREVEAGTKIVATGVPTEGYANIPRGIVKLSKLMSDGRQQIVGLQFAPDFVGHPFC